MASPGGPPCSGAGTAAAVARHSQTSPLLRRRREAGTLRAVAASRGPSCPAEGRPPPKQPWHRLCTRPPELKAWPPIAEVVGQISVTRGRGPHSRLVLSTPREGPAGGAGLRRGGAAGPRLSRKPWVTQAVVGVMPAQEPVTAWPQWPCPGCGSTAVSGWPLTPPMAAAQRHQAEPLGPRSGRAASPRGKRLKETRFLPVGEAAGTPRSPLATLTRAAVAEASDPDVTPCPGVPCALRAQLAGLHPGLGRVPLTPCMLPSTLESPRQGWPPGRTGVRRVL